MRGSAVASAGLGLLGAVGLITSTIRPIATYVSESGVSGAPMPVLYRLSIFTIAATLALLALATRAVMPLAALTLALAAPLTVVSGAVSCSEGCPLPPYEDPTAADLVHAGASVSALSLCGLTMLILAWRPGPLRRVAVVGLLIAVPLLAAAGLSMLIAGRGLTTGVLERLALTATLAWLIAAASVLVRQPSRSFARTSTPTSAVSVNSPSMPVRRKMPNSSRNRP